MAQRVLVASSHAHLGKVDEDVWLVEELSSRGVDAQLVSWDDPTQRWVCDAVVMRSVWGYQHALPQFLGWLGLLESRGVPVLNPTGMVRGNIDKTRQLEWLRGEGFPRVPTALIRASDMGRRLGELLRELLPGAGKVVLKPAVSASGHDTLLVDVDANGGLAEAERMLASVLRRPGSEAVLVQPFMKEIAHGEHALVFLGGEFSHVFVRHPGVVGQRRPSVHLDAALPAHLRLAESVVGALDQSPTYARIDLVETADGPVVMEVELAEPYLGFGLLPEPRRRKVMARFADVILAATCGGGAGS